MCIAGMCSGESVPEAGYAVAGAVAVSCSV